MNLIGKLNELLEADSEIVVIDSNGIEQPLSVGAKIEGTIAEKTSKDAISQLLFDKKRVNAEDVIELQKVTNKVIEFYKENLSKSASEKLKALIQSDTNS